MPVARQRNIIKIFQNAKKAYEVWSQKKKMLVRNLNMKLTLIILIYRAKVYNKRILKGLLIIDLILGLLFWYYQPKCEPCLYINDCPPCLSKQQYYIIYFGVILNLFYIINSIYKNRKNQV